MFRKDGWFRRRRIWVICFVLMLLLGIAMLSRIEIHLEPELVAAIRLDPAFFPDGKIYQTWHAVYEAYDGYPGTWIHPHEPYQSRSIDAWPEMDLENYTYIITYCQEIESLTYNPWKENTVPVRTFAKEGHMVMKNDIVPLTIFIYRIPKMRINHPDF